MKPILENNILSTDLDCQFFNLLNVNQLTPAPPGLVSSTDPRLTDARNPLPGSVVNASVATSAGIVQSKLALDGFIPIAWLGTTSSTAAQGDQAEYLSHKAVANGYASLDGSAKVPAAQLPTGFGTGTVTSVGLTMPAAFTVTGSPITTSGTIGVQWNNVADQSWFGNNTGATGLPQFYTTPLPVTLIPAIDASKVTSGVFSAALLPVAIGIGPSHVQGAVPDPGDGTGGALSTDYLARDMTYKPAPVFDLSYQPTIPTITIGISGNKTGPITVTASSTVTDAVYFYSFTSATAAFLEFPPEGYVTVPVGPTGNQVWVYGAHPGYNNSAVETFINTNP